MMQGRWAGRARVLGLVGAAALSTLTLGAASIFGDDPEPPCWMAPPHIQIALPHDGFAWVEGEEQTGQCEAVPVEKWIRKSSGPSDFFVYADGPSGSGRYWTLTFGIGKKTSPKPHRGTCLATSTVGWRTLQQFKVSPLPWLDDVDGDGKAEVLLWDSFPLHGDASSAEFGLMAWVYHLSAKGALVLDWKLSRRMARDIAAAYRTPLASSPQAIALNRAEAATALEMFADARCTVPKQNNR